MMTCTGDSPCSYTTGDKGFHYCRLHLAAPDLLAALELLLKQEANLAGECGWCFLSPFGKCTRESCPGVIARTAIKKAGEAHNEHHPRAGPGDGGGPQ